MKNQDFFPKEKRMSLEELQASYSQQKLSDLSLEEKTNERKRGLINKYKHYLYRYINAYAQYSIEENENKKRELRSITMGLINKIKDIENETNSEIKMNKEILLKLKSKIMEQTHMLEIKNKNQELLNTLIINKNIENNTHSDKILNSEELLNHVRLSYYLLLFLLVVFSLVFIYLSIKYSIRINESVFTFNLPWLR
tara:strand:+ start:118 stop:708 length:591 start_codon:yes stop_codon:yes gene_type:complete